MYGTYTLSEAFHNTQEWVLRGVSTYLLIFAALPLALVPLAFALPRHKNAETFGHGSMREKALILLAGSCLAIIIAGFRAGTTWEPPRSLDNPAWYDSRTALYCFNFLEELLILLLYTTTGIDKSPSTSIHCFSRYADHLAEFHVPNGSSKRQSFVPPDQVHGSGRCSDADDTDADSEKTTSGTAV